MTLIKRCFATPDNRGRNTWKGFYTAHSAYGVGMLHRNRPNFEREFRRCRECVAPRIHGSGTGMRLLTQKRNCVPLHSFGSEHNRERQAQVFEHRTLLNVKLEIGGRVLLFPLRFRETFNLYSATAQCIFERNSIVVLAYSIGRNGVRARKRG